MTPPRSQSARKPSHQLMKTRYCTVLLSCLVLLLPRLQAGQLAEADFARMGLLRTAIVDYTMEAEGLGSTMKGARTLWLDAYGTKQATRTKENRSTKILGQESKEQSDKLSILDGTYSYEIDMLAKTGSKMNMKELAGIAQAYADSQQAKGRSSEDVAREWVEKLGGKVIGHESFMGRDCIVYEIMGHRTWSYRNITLKTEGSLMGVRTREIATRVQENVSLPSDVFKVPAGITLSEESLMAGDVAGTEEAAFAKDPMAAIKQMMSQEEESSQDPDTTIEGVRMNLGEFRSFAAKLKPAGYKAPRIETDGESFTAEFRKSLTESLILSVARVRAPREFLEELASDSGEGVDAKALIKVKGMEGVYVRESQIGGSGNGSLFYCVDPRKGISVALISTPSRSLEDCTALLTQLGY